MKKYKELCYKKIHWIRCINRDDSNTKYVGNNSIDEYVNYNIFFYDDNIVKLDFDVKSNTNFCNNELKNTSRSVAIDIEGVNSRIVINALNVITNIEDIDNIDDNIGKSNQTFIDKNNIHEVKNLIDFNDGFRQQNVNIQF